MSDTDSVTKYMLELTQEVGKETYLGAILVPHEFGGWVALEDYQASLTKRDERIAALEQENAKLKQALSGRTVSCEACNQMAKEIERLKKELFKCHTCNGSGMRIWHQDHELCEDDCTYTGTGKRKCNVCDGKGDIRDFRRPEESSFL